REIACGQAQTPPGAVQVTGDPRFARVILDLLHSSEFEAGAAPRLLGLEALLEEILHQALLVKAQLGIHLALAGRAAHQGSYPTHLGASYFTACSTSATAAAVRSHS